MWNGISCPRWLEHNRQYFCLSSMGKQHSGIQERVVCELHVKQFSHWILLLGHVWMPPSSEVCSIQMRTVPCFTWTATQFHVDGQWSLENRFHTNQTKLKISKDSSIKCFPGFTHVFDILDTDIRPLPQILLIGTIKCFPFSFHSYLPLLRGTFTVC